MQTKTPMPPRESKCNDDNMIVHGRSPQDIAREARKAWIALGLTPVVMVVLVVGGESLYSALGYADQTTLSSVPRAIVSLVVAPIALAAPILAARWGHHAFSAGNKAAAIPGLLGPIIAVLLGTVMLGAALGLA
jgi:flagellar biosynthesis protein FliQ